MTRTEQVFDITVIFGARIFIANEHGQRSSRSFSFENTGKNFNRVRFFALGRDLALSRTAAVKIDLNVRFSQRNLGWNSVDDQADGRPMAFAKGCDAKQFSESISCHMRYPPFVVRCSLLVDRN